MRGACRHACARNGALRRGAFERHHRGRRRASNRFRHCQVRVSEIYRRCCEVWHMGVCRARAVRVCPCGCAQRRVLRFADAGVFADGSQPRAGKQDVFAGDRESAGGSDRYRRNNKERDGLRAGQSISVDCRFISGASCGVQKTRQFRCAAFAESTGCFQAVGIAVPGRRFWFARFATLAR